MHLGRVCRQMHRALLGALGERVDHSEPSGSSLRPACLEVGARDQWNPRLMWPAVSLDDVFERAKSVTDRSDPAGERLVSLVFAPPRARLWHELKYSVAYLDAQTGDDWDLFFIGVPAVARKDSIRGQDWSRYFQAKKFHQVEREVHRYHANALEQAGLDVGRAWRHTGGSDLVSVLSHYGKPDWLSLTACRIDSRGDQQAEMLSEVAARQRDWREGEDDPMFWRDPYHERIGGGVHDLERALVRTAAVVGGGVAGNAAYELVRGLLGH